MAHSVAFFDAKSYDRVSFDAANSDYGFEIHYLPVRLDRDTVALAGGADVVCAFVNDSVDSEVIFSLVSHDIGLIALRSSGYNNVDLASAYEKVHVVRVPAYSPHAVAEHAVALMLSLNRKTHRAYYRIRDNNFSIQGLMGFDMYGKTAGVVGTGQIGRILIGILKGFGMNVVAYDPFPKNDAATSIGFEYRSLDDLFRESDIISLHCPLTEETHHIVNSKTLALMKPSSMIINTGRGALIDTPALVDALRDGRIGAAGLDVYEEEEEYFFEDRSSTNMDDDVLARLISFNSVLVTSHQAFFTQEALANIAATTLANVKAYIDGKPLENEICYRCNKDTCAKKTSGRCF